MAAAGVELRVGAGCGGERVVVAIVLSNALAVPAVAGCYATSFNPRVFIRRHDLVGQLATQPHVSFGQYHTTALRHRSQDGSDTPAAANHENRCLHFTHASDSSLRNSSLRLHVFILHHALCRWAKLLNNRLNVQQSGSLTCEINLQTFRASIESCTHPFACEQVSYG